MSQIHFGKFVGGTIGPHVESHDYHRDDYFAGGTQGSDSEEFRIEAGQTSATQQNVGDSERVLSLAAGVGLGLVGLVRGRLSGLALTAMGAALAWRGYTGHC